MQQRNQKEEDVDANFNAGQAQVGLAYGWEVRLLEFIRLAPPFKQKSTDTIQVETWVTKVEKAFRAC